MYTGDGRREDLRDILHGPRGLAVGAGSTGLGLLRDHLDFIKSIALETLPAAILLGPAVVTVARRWRASEPDLMLAAILYSTLCTLDS